MFLNSCELVYALCLSDFVNDHSRVLWTLSFMKTGRASSFVEQTLQWEARRAPLYASYAVFQTVFIEKFCPVNEAWSAIMHLESHEYHQGPWDVDSYINEFEDLVEVSGYTDPILIVLKFRQGLNTVIQNKVAESGTDCPNDEDFDSWYGAAKRFDQNHLANEAFLMAPIQCINQDHDTAPTREANTPCTPTPHFATLQQISKPTVAVRSISNKR